VKIRILYFAIVRERLGLDQEDYELDDGARVHDLLTLVERRHDSLAQGVASVRVAVNNEYVDSDHALADGDEVAVIPPVSGG